jgi:surface protein
MKFIFFGNEAAQPDTSNWNTANVKDMSYMFHSAELANPDTSGWNTANVLTMRSMFSGATLANPDTSNWNTAKVTNMQFMFSNASSANPDTSSWDISQVTHMSSMFNGITLPTLSYDAILVGFNSQMVQPGVEFDAGNSKYCAIDDRDNLVNLNGWFISDGGLESDCSSLSDDFVIKVDTRNAGTSSTTEFEIRTFGNGYNYNVDCDDNSPLTNITTAETGNYTCQYATPGIYTIRIKDNTGNGTGFPRIHLNNVGDKNKLIDILQWGTGQWTTMEGAFFGASNMKVTASDVPNLTQVTSLNRMFIGAHMANPDTSSWDTTNITDMSFMFYSAGLANPDTSGWVTTNVTDMSYMFTYAYLANPDTSNWNITNVTTMRNMFDGVTLPTSSYDAMLINFNSQTVQSSVEFNGGNSTFCASTDRDELILFDMWSITDGGLDSLCNDGIFKNSFELPIEMFNASNKMFTYDFALLENIKADTSPRLIAIGFNDNQEKVIKFFIRKIGKNLQILMSNREINTYQEETWINQQWQNKIDFKLTTVSW